MSLITCIFWAVLVVLAVIMTVTTAMVILLWLEQYVDPMLAMLAIVIFGTVLMSFVIYWEMNK